MKKFTPPRNLGSQSGSDYSDSEDSYYSGSSYTSNSYSSSDSEDEQDETLKAMRVSEKSIFDAKFCYLTISRYVHIIFIIN